MMSFPDREIYDGSETFAHQVLYGKAAHPFSQSAYDPAAHESKLTFRLTVPLVVRFLHLNAFAIFIMKYLVGILLFYLVLRLSYDIFKDRLYAFIITVSVGQVFAGTAALVESVVMFDGAAIVLLLLAMYLKNPAMKTVLVFLAGFCDERALIASPLVMIYEMDDSIGSRSFFKALRRPACLSVPAAWILYLICRLLLMNIYGLKTETGDVGFHLIPVLLHYLPLGLWSALEGFWILIVLAIVLLLHERKFLFAMIFLSAMAIVILTAFSVLDVTRSLAYLLPSLFVSFKVLSRNKSLDLRKILFAVLLISLICPNFYVCGNGCFIWSPSLFVRIICNSF